MNLFKTLISFRFIRNTKTSHTTMPQSIKDKWLTALRSGEHVLNSEGIIEWVPKYKQGRGRLHIKESDRYCCLGVLVDCVDNQFLCDITAYPSMIWLKEHNINFQLMKLDAMFWNDLDLNLNYGKYKSSYFVSASQCNDFLKCSFLEIADMIEAQVEGI